jgi:hypothetical protein
MNTMALQASAGAMMSSSSPCRTTRPRIVSSLTLLERVLMVRMIMLLVLLQQYSIDIVVVDGFMGSFWEHYNSLRSSTSHDTRYFTQEGYLPPLLTCHGGRRDGRLQKHDDTTAMSTNSTLWYGNDCDDMVEMQEEMQSASRHQQQQQQHQNQMHCGTGVIPVTYTNNPMVVDEWLCKNLPYDGSIIGFDVEVSGGTDHDRKDRIAVRTSCTAPLSLLSLCVCVCVCVCFALRAIFATYVLLF